MSRIMSNDNETDRSEWRDEDFIAELERKLTAKTAELDRAVKYIKTSIFYSRKVLDYHPPRSQDLSRMCQATEQLEDFLTDREDEIKDKFEDLLMGD